MTARLCVTVWLSLVVPAWCAAQDEPSPAPDMQVAPVGSRSVGLRLRVGIGVGTRAFVVPRAIGVQALDRSAFAVTDFELALRFWRTQKIGCEVQIAYQTSVGWKLQQEPLFALPETIAARAQRLDVSVAPVVHLGSARSDRRLTFPIGFGLRSFWPRPKQSPIADFLLAGPYLRAELHLPLVAAVSLRIGPELQWLLLTKLRGTDAETGVAVGGTVALSSRLIGSTAFAIAYRASYASVTASGSMLEDVEQYAAVQFQGEL